MSKPARLSKSPAANFCAATKSPVPSAPRSRFETFLQRSRTQEISAIRSNRASAYRIAHDALQLGTRRKALSSYSTRAASLLTSRRFKHSRACLSGLRLGDHSRSHRSRRPHVSSCACLLRMSRHKRGKPESAPEPDLAQFVLEGLVSGPHVQKAKPELSISLRERPTDSR